METYQIKSGKKVKNFVLQKKIGEGAFGTVWLALDVRTSDLCAVKIVPKKLF